MSKHTEAIKEAFCVGYRVDCYGLVTLNGNPVKSTMSANGYMMFSFRSDAVGWQRISVSKFAGFQKFGEAALGESVEVRHMNGVPTDNRPDNLQIGTPTDNRMDIPLGVRIRTSKIAAEKLRKLTSELAEQLREERRNGAGLKILSKKYGISKTAASYIVNRKTYL